ncbi:MAG: site-specific DNA-methyltransferase [Nitrososphaera sp.]|jgi:DNA modification methylase
MMSGKINQIIYGDSYKTLLQLEKESVDLCYLDPPFFSNRIYETVSANGKINSFEDKWDNDLDKYIGYMRNVLLECHKVLKKTGSLYLHCDWHASHYLKIELDNIFGRNNFRNEIIWRRHNAHNDTKQGAKILGRVHDTILFFSKSNEYTWNPIYEPYPDYYTKKYYKHIEPETGRKYAHGDLSGPGGKSKGNPQYSFLGVTRYWRFSKENMEKLYQQGRIIQTSKGSVPILKRYLDEMPGLMLQDMWNDIDSVQVTKKESVEYPTQKPIKLLERIIQISSNPKDLVLDPFCGSGTTLIAAVNLDRNYLGIDCNSQAVEISRKRIRSRQMKPENMVIQKISAKRK